MSQKFDNNVLLDLIEQKGFYPYEHMNDFEKLWNDFGVLKFWNKFKMKTTKNYQYLYLKWNVLLLADVFEKLRNNSIKIMGCVQVFIWAQKVPLTFTDQMKKAKKVPERWKWTFHNGQYLQPSNKNIALVSEHVRKKLWNLLT